MDGTSGPDRDLDQPADDRVRYRLSRERIEQLEPLLGHFDLPPREDLWPRLNRALIHRSYRTEAALDEDNERLEFLGDSVIGLAATEYILREQPLSDEGKLSKLRATIVSRALLGELGQRMAIGPLLLLGAGEARSGGHDRASIIGSALEAVCGAFYLTYPWEQVRAALQNAVIIPAMGLRVESGVVDFKSRLQEWSQKVHQQVPHYRLVADTGPDHEKLFRVEVYLEGKRLGVGEGPRKKSAENSAARDALDGLFHEDADP